MARPSDIIVIAAGFFFAGCVNDHVGPANYTCDQSHPVTFDAVAPIIAARCATKACHAASNVYIPTLESKQQLTANKSDCLIQIQNGAMPPSGYILTLAERQKILCWLNFGE